MGQAKVWLGMAILGLKESNIKKRQGFVGAFAAVACAALDVAEATRLISCEFDENGYELLGFESLMPAQMLERELTDYEAVLVESAASYPVQFKDVHLHKGDA